jgi:hypothetical protein
MMNSCCPKLEELMRPTGAGFGVVRLSRKRGTWFFLEYRKDWRVPVAEAGLQIRFCPLCGADLVAGVEGAGS